MHLDIVEGTKKAAEVRKLQWQIPADDSMCPDTAERDELAAKMQAFYGITWDQAQAQIGRFEERNGTNGPLRQADCRIDDQARDSANGVFAWIVTAT